MLPDRVSNQGPLTYVSGALPIALRGPAGSKKQTELNDGQTPISHLAQVGKTEKGEIINFSQVERGEIINLL